MDIIYVHQTKICYKMVVHILFLKVIDLARCEVCKINGNNKDMYIAHLARKKRLKTIKPEILYWHRCRDRCKYRKSQIRINQNQNQRRHQNWIRNGKLWKEM